MTSVTLVPQLSTNAKSLDLIKSPAFAVMV